MIQNETHCVYTYHKYLSFNGTTYTFIPTVNNNQRIDLHRTYRNDRKDIKYFVISIINYYDS